MYTICSKCGEPLFSYYVAKDTWAFECVQCGYSFDATTDEKQFNHIIKYKKLMEE